MKPLQTTLRFLIPCAIALPAVVAALDPADIEKASVDSLIAALPAPSIDKIWVKVRQPISVEELSSSLKLAEERLAKLNDVNEDHHFRQGDWLVVPSQQSRQIKQQNLLKDLPSTRRAADANKSQLKSLINRFS